MQEECDSGCSNNLRGRLLLKQVGGKGAIAIIIISIALAAITKLFSLLRF